MRKHKGISREGLAKVMTNTSEKVRIAFDAELDKLNKMLLDMGSQVTKHLTKSVEAISTGDAKLAQEIIDRDFEIDQMEHDIDQFAVRLLALRQPVAKDLRHVIMSIKISSHLERIADYAANICKRAIMLNDMPEVKATKDIASMAKIVNAMIRDVLEAYKNADNEKATTVWESDIVVDEMYMGILKELLSLMTKDSNNISPCTHLLFIAKNIERMGDHATNIAESVHYLVHGTLFTEQRPKGDSIRAIT